MRNALRTLAVAATFLFVQLPTANAAAAEFDLQAHRGGRGETTEESLRAFAKAIELGVSTLELDVVLSRDGQPMVWHDPSVQADKCSDTGPASAGDPQYPYVGKLVHDLTLAQLRTLDCGKLLPGFPRAEVVHGNEIATLPEVFTLADAHRATVRYDIETKVEAAEPEKSAPPEQFVDVILAAVRAADKVDDVEIQSFDWRTLPMVHAVEPGIPLVDREFVDRAHAQGLRVVPWTVDDADAMTAQIDAGVDGIITDYPTLLRRVLAGRGMPLPSSRA